MGLPRPDVCMFDHAVSRYSVTDPDIDSCGRWLITRSTLLSTNCGTANQRPRATVTVVMDDPRRQFDFWLGEWRCTWEGGAGANTIALICEGAVVHESFRSEDAELVGTSISVYDAAAGAWVAAASALKRQLKLTGSEKSSQFRATRLSIATINPIMPTTPHGTAPRRPLRRPP